jgi:hypothetical protein
MASAADSGDGISSERSRIAPREMIEVTTHYHGVGRNTNSRIPSSVSDPRQGLNLCAFDSDQRIMDLRIGAMKREIGIVHTPRREALYEPAI